jgi:hypothetical protein
MTASPHLLLHRLADPDRLIDPDEPTDCGVDEVGHKEAGMDEMPRMEHPGDIREPRAAATYESDDTQSCGEPEGVGEVEPQRLEDKGIGIGRVRLDELSSLRSWRGVRIPPRS